MNEAIFVLIIVAVCFVLLVITRKEPEVIFGAGILVLMITGLVSVETGLAGFSNPALITIACLYIVAAAIRENGLLIPFVQRLTQSVKTPHQGVVQIVVPVAFFSAFLNNTPIVASLMPALVDWCKRKQWSVSFFLLPLSYAAILGGTCTLIGTSTNLMVYGFLQQTKFANELGFFEVGLIGFPVTVVGIIYLSFCSNKFLTPRRTPLESLSQTREYCLEMLVLREGSLVGKSIAEAGLRNLHGLFLVELIRGNRIYPAIEPERLLEANDRLVFSGMVDVIGDLLSINGLKLAEDQVFQITDNQEQALFVEAVIGQRNPLIGQSIKRGGFRNYYQAVVLAVVRNGQRITQKTGDIVIKPGDTLLLLSNPRFVEQFRFSQDFLVVGGLDEYRVPDRKKSFWVWTSLSVLIVLAASGVVPVVIAAMSAVAVILVTGSLDLKKTRQALDLQVLLTIAFAFGLGSALIESGAAKLMAEGILALVGNNPFLLLIGVYFLTLILTEMVTNNAAAVISFSLVSGVVLNLDYNLVPYAVVIMIAASASFISPMGYQTNLMVYSAGGYRMVDYLKLGLPLSALTAMLTLFLTPLIWTLK